MAPKTTLRAAIGLGMALALVGAIGCEKEAEGAPEAAEHPATTTQMAVAIGDGGGAGGAPRFGDQTGTGFPSGDAYHNSGGGSGLEGYNGTGAFGTSATVSDLHAVEAPAKSAPPPVLPEQ